MTPTPPPGPAPDDAPEPAARERRWAVLRDLEDWLERPMLVLSFAWLGLFVLEFTRGLSPALEAAGYAIWAAFVLEFLLRFALAPDRGDYLKANWLTALSLLVPAVRVFRLARLFRVLRAARAARGLRLVKVVGSFNRGIRALGRSFARRGFGYVVALTALLTFAGAAGVYAFERDVPGSPLTSYGSALWWTAMVMTTMGSDYFPRSAEGRALCLVLAVFAFAVFGYVTAALATFFVGRDAEASDAEVAGQGSVDALAAEVRALRAEVRALVAAAGVTPAAGPPPAPPPPPPPGPRG
jgi:voltage-gated potassium channel